MLLIPSRRSRSALMPPVARGQGSPRGRWLEACGFSLIELLIVILIVSILVAIAIPMFVGPQMDAVDAQAKALARNAATVAATIAADDQGSFAKVSPSELHSQERAIDTAESSNEAYISKAEGNTDGYQLTARAKNGDEFTIADSAGEVRRTCVSRVTKTGCNGGEESSW